MKVDKADNVDGVSISRGLFIASFGAFIFTSLFGIAAGQTASFGQSATATVFAASYKSSEKLALVQAEDRLKYDNEEDITVGGGTSTGGSGINTGGNNGGYVSPTVSKSPLSTPTNPIPYNSKAKLIVNTSTYFKNCYVQSPRGVKYTVSSNGTGETGLLTENTLFTLNCTHVLTRKVSKVAELNILVAPKATVEAATASITVPVNPVQYNAKAAFVVKTTGYKDCYVQSPRGMKYPTAPNNSSETGSLTEDTALSLNCTNVQTGVSSKVSEVKIKVMPKVIASASITTKSNPIPYNTKATLIISTVGYKDCYVQSPRGVKYPTTAANTSETGPLTEDTTFTLNCTNIQTSVTSKVSDVKIKVSKAPVDLTAKISAAPSIVKQGDVSTLNWKSTGATSCNVYVNATNTTPWKGNENATDVKTQPILKVTTYVLTCTNGTKVVSDTVVIGVKAPIIVKPTVDLKVESLSVQDGDSVKITWSSKNADKCALMQGLDVLGNTTSGSMNSKPITSATVIWLSCSSLGGSDVDSQEVRLKNAKILPKPRDDDRLL